MTTYQIHTVQHIEPPTQGSEEEEDDETEAVLRSFRIKTLSESPRHSVEVRTSPIFPSGAVHFWSKWMQKLRQISLSLAVCLSSAARAIGKVLTPESTFE